MIMERLTKLFSREGESIRENTVKDSALFPKDPKQASAITGREHPKVVADVIRS